MEKKELVTALARKIKIDAARAELAVNEVVAQLASPYVFRKPGEEVAALINDCNNHCREELAMTEMKTPARGG